MSVEISDERRSATQQGATIGAEESDGRPSDSAARPRAATRSGQVRLLLISMWLGAAIFFFGVAQSAFGVLPTRELAGALVGRTLAILNISGFAISLALLAGALFVKDRAAQRGGRLLRAEIVSLLAMAAATGVGQWVIAARLAAMRAAASRPLDELAQNDPLRVAFGSWHLYSVLVLFVAVIAAAAVCLLSVARGQARPHT